MSRRRTPLPTVAPASGAITGLRPTKSPGKVIPVIERNLIKKDGTKRRREWGIHPSELAKPNPCARRMYYQLSGWGKAAHLEEYEPSHGESFSARSLQIFAEGHSIHDKWQGWMWDAGLLWGEYWCINCDHKWLATAPTECEECQAGRLFLKYLEVPIRSPKHLIVGHADGKVTDHLMEIKSVGAGTVRMEAPVLYAKHAEDVGDPTGYKLWNDIKRPFPSHVKQGMIYAWVHGVREMVYIYEWKATQATKEFTVKVRMATLQPLLDLCLVVKDALEDGEPPRKGYMKTSDACKGCEYRGVCWPSLKKKQKEEHDGEEAPAVVIRRIPAS